MKLLWKFAPEIALDIVLALEIALDIALALEIALEIALALKIALDIALPHLSPLSPCAAFRAHLHPNAAHTHNNQCALKHQNM